MITNDVPVFFLKPGEVRLSREPEIVITILGSCVAIIMFDSDSGISMATHCVLPSRKNFEEDCCCENFKYVDTSISNMLEVFKGFNIPEYRIKVKLFGGAEQLKNNSKRHSVGKQNVLKALDILDSHKLDIISMDVGGNEGRKIYLLSNSGEVLLTRLGNQNLK